MERYRAYALSLSPEGLEREERILGNLVNLWPCPWCCLLKKDIEAKYDLILSLSAKARKE